MEFILSIMFIISFVSVLIISARVIYLLKKLADSKYRNCAAYITLDQEQFDDLMFVIRELARMN